MEGTEAGTDQWVIVTSFFSIGFLMLVPLNFSFRQQAVKGIINISDLNFYSKIADACMARAILMSHQPDYNNCD